MVDYITDDKFDIFRPEVWTPRVSRFFRDKLYAANFFKDYSADVQSADAVHIPHFDELNSTASDIAVTNGTVTKVGIGDTATVLTVDAWKGAAVVISKFEEREIMKRPNVIDEYASYLGYRCAKNAETAILANASMFTASVGSSVLQILATQLEEAFGVMASNNVPKEECRLFIEPKAYWKGIMGIQKYYDASQFGRASLPVGTHDMLYGVGISLTNNLTNSLKVGLVNCLAHPSSIAFAMYGPDFQVKSDTSLAKRIIADIMYGDAVVRKGAGVRIISTVNI